MRLAGRVALITGASRGIGRAIAMELAREGVDVAVNYRKQAAAAEETAAEIRALGRRAVIVHTDISDAAACAWPARRRRRSARSTSWWPMAHRLATVPHRRPAGRGMASRARHRSPRMLLHDSKSGGAAVG